MNVNTVNDESLKILSVMPDEISEELFKEKIGRGDELKKLQDLGILRIDNSDNISINQNCDKILKIKKLINDKEIKEIHEDILNEFYIPKVNSFKIDSYSEFMDCVQYFINTSYHLNCLRKYDESIKYIFKIAKKMVYWGKKDFLKLKLKEYEKLKISKVNIMWKEYFNLFSDIIVDDFQIYEESNFEDRFLSLESSEKEDKLLFIEVKNLEGIYWRNCKNNKEKSLEIYNSVLDNFYNYDFNKEDTEINIARSRLLQNKALCYWGNDSQEVFKIMNKAEKILEKCNDKYELLKFYCNKLTFLYENNNNDPKIIDYLMLINSYIKDSDYPDLERQYYNLLSKMFYNSDENEDIDHYFEIKSYVFQLDMLLYYPYFINDFINMFDNIENDIKEKKFDIIKGLDRISSVLNELDLDDEYYFVLALQQFIKGEEYKDAIEKVNIKPMIDFFNDYTENLR